MAVLYCPHCTSVAIIVGGLPEGGVCLKRGCGGILDMLLEDSEAGKVIRAAYYGHDHGFMRLSAGELDAEIARVRSVNEGLQRFAKSINETEAK